MRKILSQTQITRTMTYLVAAFLVVAGTATYYFHNSSGASCVGCQDISVSGTLTDSITNKPVPNASVYLQVTTPTFGKSIQVKTDAKGNYAASLPSPTTDYTQISVQIAQFGNTPYTESGYEVPVNANFIATGANIILSQIPADVRETDTLDPISAQCRTQPGKIKTGKYMYDLGSNGYHTGDYKGEMLNGVLFCVSTNPVDYSSIFDENRYGEDIAYYAAQIHSLVISSHLPFTPSIYIVPEILEKGADGGSAGAFTPTSGHEITIQADNIPGYAGLELITHEFGHLVDWEKGLDHANTAANKIAYGYDRDCLLDTTSKNYHCMDSHSPDFVYATSIISNEKFLTKYGSSDQGEMFAEVFSALNTPDGTSPSLKNKFTARQNAEYDITNALAGIFANNLTYASCLNLNAYSKVNKDSDTCVYQGQSSQPTTVEAMNAAMYVFNFMTNASILSQYFPGTLSSGYTYNQIWYGKFMDSAVVTVNVRNPKNIELPNVPVTIGKVSGTTRAGSSANSDHTNFDTTGTLVLLNATPGSTHVIAGGFSSPATLVQGANPLIQMTVAPTVALPITGLYPTAIVADSSGKVYVGQVDRQDDQGNPTECSVEAFQHVTNTNTYKQLYTTPIISVTLNQTAWTGTPVTANYCPDSLSLDAQGNLFVMSKFAYEGDNPNIGGAAQATIGMYPILEYNHNGYDWWDVTGHLNGSTNINAAQGHPGIGIDHNNNLYINTANDAQQSVIVDDLSGNLVRKFSNFPVSNDDSVWNVGIKSNNVFVNHLDQTTQATSTKVYTPFATTFLKQISGSEAIEDSAGYVYTSTMNTDSTSCSAMMYNNFVSVWSADSLSACPEAIGEPGTKTTTTQRIGTTSHTTTTYTPGVIYGIIPSTQSVVAYMF